MTATQFIDTPKIHLKPIKTLAKNQDIQESHKLNYSIISFLNREVVDNLTLFVEQGIISNKDILELKTDILIPSALENQITIENVNNIKAKYSCFQHTEKDIYTDIESFSKDIKN